MTRQRITLLVKWALAIALVGWIATHTYWTEIQVPMPLKGEAATNPFYAAQQFAKVLGARAHWNRGLDLPPGTGIAVVSAWHWELSADRQRRIEQWVESGGRLIVDKSLISSTDAFAHWSGIGREAQQRRKRIAIPEYAGTRCYTLNEGETDDSYSICEMDASSALTTSRPIAWALRRYDAGIQALRVKLGRGSVTVINGTPFVGRSLFYDDNARLFVAATQLRRGDEIHFFTESSHASLLELAWQLGWPVVCLLLALIVLALWRGSARFGPPAAPVETARRSLAEQIRGTGQFTMRIGGGAPLHAATARALNEAAARYISAYEHLPGAERMHALAHATGYEADALAAALHYSGSRRSESLREAVELLESARRRILIKNTRSRDGNRI